MTWSGLFDPPFLADPFVRLVLRILASDGEEARVIGGAVRNTLLGLPIADIDIATTALPQRVIERAEAAHLKAVPTGIEHGTVTLVGAHRVVEVTTLREDIETDGRHAVVRFGRDWAADAARRDFTINALSADIDGILYDPAGGLADIAARRVRFIGAADERIAEDRLRALRFFRFHAAYGDGSPDPAGLSAVISARHDMASLSAERIGQEMRKLVVAPRAAQTLRTMQESGFLPLIAAGVADLAAFDRLPDIEGPAVSAALRLAVLFAFVQEDIDRIVRRFRLGNNERDRMTNALAAARAIDPAADAADRAAIYRVGSGTFIDGLIFAMAKGWLDPACGARRRAAAENWQVPVFPLSGRDVVDFGIGRGPSVGVILRDLERWWIAQGFRPDAAALRHRLQTIVASQQ